MKFGCLLTTICVITGLLGFAQPIFFLVPVVVISFVIIINKIIAKYTTSIDQDIDSENSEKLIATFDTIAKKYKLIKSVKIVFQKTYDHFLTKAFQADLPNKKEILLYYKNNLDDEFFSSHTKDFIDPIIDVIAKMDQPTEEHFAYVDDILSYFVDIAPEIQIEAEIKLDVIRKITDLHKNGLQPLDIHNPITEKKDCFYYGTIHILKNRQKDGQKFYEYDKTGEIYILRDEIDIIADGHKKIKMSAIISMDYADGILQLTIMNRQTPLGLSSGEMEYIVAILNMLQ